MDPGKRGARELTELTKGCILVVALLWGIGGSMGAVVTELRFNLVPRVDGVPGLLRDLANSLEAFGGE